MHFKRIPKAIVVGALVLLLCATCALGALCWSIQSGLDQWCAIAQQSHPHPGDDVAALLAYVQSESHSLRYRDYAVWALGQARDARVKDRVNPASRIGFKTSHFEEQTVCRENSWKSVGFRFSGGSAWQTNSRWRWYRRY